MKVDFISTKKGQQYQTSMCYDCKNRNRNEIYVYKKTEKVPICKKCNIEKDWTRFFFNKKVNRHDTSKCYDCRNKERNDRRKIDEKYRISQNNRYIEWSKKQDRSDYNRNWSKQNRQHINDSRKNRQKNDIHCYIRESVRSRIGDCLRNYVKGSYKKTECSFKYIGCDMSMYVAWLEFNFDDKIN